MFKEKMKELKAQILNIGADINAKTEELKTLLNEGDLEKAREVRAEIDSLKAQKSEAENNLKSYEAAEAGSDVKTVGQAHKVEEETKSYRESVNEFIRSKGRIRNEGLRFEGKDEVLIPMNDINPTSDGLKKDKTKPVTSEEIVTTPLREVKTVVDLKQFTTIHKATKGSGKYPILKRATAKMVSVAELEKNPALAKPEFESVAWEVATYRGAIPVSQESIDDADVDLLAIVSEAISQIKVNTTNDAIAKILKSFEEKTAGDLDAIKSILNVDFDPAYNVSFVVTQSFYQVLDTLKDKNGRYLLQDSIVSSSGKVFLGHPVFVVSDEALGAKGEAKAFVGDVNRAILFADRADLGLRWADNEIYGQYLQAVMRFDVKKADAKAGYFVTFTPTPSR